MLKILEIIVLRKKSDDLVLFRSMCFAGSPEAVLLEDIHKVVIRTLWERIIIVTGLQCGPCVGGSSHDPSLELGV